MKAAFYVEMKKRSITGSFQKGREMSYKVNQLFLISVDLDTEDDNEAATIFSEKITKEIKNLIAKARFKLGDIDLEEGDLNVRLQEDCESMEAVRSNDILIDELNNWLPQDTEYTDRAVVVSRVGSDKDGNK